MMCPSLWENQAWDFLYRDEFSQELSRMKELKLEHDQLTRQLEMERDQLAKELQMLSKSGYVSMQGVDTGVECSEVTSKQREIWPTDILNAASGSEEEVLHWNMEDVCINDAATLPTPPSMPVLSQTVLQLRDLVTALKESPLLSTNDFDTQVASRIKKESCGTASLASAKDQCYSDSMHKLRLQESDCENVKHQVHSLCEFLISNYHDEVYPCKQDEEDVSPDEAELLKELMELKMERQEKQRTIQERKALLLGLSAQIEQNLCDVNTASKEIACGVDSIYDTLKSWSYIDDEPADDEVLSWTRSLGSEKDDDRNNAEEQGKEDQHGSTASPCLESCTMAQESQPMFVEAINNMEVNKDKRRVSFFERDSDDASTFADDEALSSAWLSSRGSIARSISKD